MYCPQCKCEFVEGKTLCSDCNIPLVAELPPGDEESGSRVNSTVEKVLKYSALVAGGGIAFTAIIRTINSLFSNVLGTPNAIRIIVFLTTVGTLSLVLFFSFFLLRHPKTSRWLKIATLLSLTGTLFMLFKRLYAIATVFELSALKLFIIQNLKLGSELFFIAALTYPFFFFHFKKNLGQSFSSGSSKWDKSLTTAGNWAFWGSLVIALYNLIFQTSRIVFNYPLKAGSSLSNGVLYLLFPVILFAIFTQVLFYFTYYKSLDKINHHPE